MKIEATQDDIDIGIPNDCACCPVALAVNRRNRRVFTTVVRVRSEVTAFYDLYSGLIILSVKTPREAREFIERFDERHKVAPFSFNLSAECFMP